MRTAGSGPAGFPLRRRHECSTKRSPRSPSARRPDTARQGAAAASTRTVQAMPSAGNSSIRHSDGTQTTKRGFASERAGARGEAPADRALTEEVEAGELAVKLRHTAAAAWMAAGNSLMYVQRQLGHADNQHNGALLRPPRTAHVRGQQIRLTAYNGGKGSARERRRNPLPVRWAAQRSRGCRANNSWSALPWPNPGPSSQVPPTSFPTCECGNLATLTLATTSQDGPQRCSRRPDGRDASSAL